MNKLIIAIILFVIIGVGDFIYTYNNFGSVFWEMEMQNKKREDPPYEYERPERKSQIPEAESDFVNQIDCEEYFADENAVYYPEDNEYLVSHNVLTCKQSL